MQLEVPFSEWAAEGDPEWIADAIEPLVLAENPYALLCAAGVVANYSKSSESVIEWVRKIPFKKEDLEYIKRRLRANIEYMSDGATALLGAIANTEDWKANFHLITCMRDNIGGLLYLLRHEDLEDIHPLVVALDTNVVNLLGENNAANLRFEDGRLDQMGKADIWWDSIHETP